MLGSVRGAQGETCVPTGIIDPAGPSSRWSSPPGPPGHSWSLRFRLAGTPRPCRRTAGGHRQLHHVPGHDLGPGAVRGAALFGVTPELLDPRVQLGSAGWQHDGGEGVGRDRVIGAVAACAIHEGPGGLSSNRRGERGQQAAAKAIAAGLADPGHVSKPDRDALGRGIDSGCLDSWVAAYSSKSAPVRGSGSGCNPQAPPLHCRCEAAALWTVLYPFFPKAEPHRSYSTSRGRQNSVGWSSCPGHACWRGGVVARAVGAAVVPGWPTGVARRVPPLLVISAAGHRALAEMVLDGLHARHLLGQEDQRPALGLVVHHAPEMDHAVLDDRVDEGAEALRA